jgi:hypothetical protein
VPTAEEGGQEEGMNAAIGGPHTCLAMEGNGLVGLHASCDHEVGEKAGVGSARPVGDEVDVGGGDHQLCVAEVTW